jgi:hypothetical protein
MRTILSKNCCACGGVLAALAVLVGTPGAMADVHPLRVVTQICENQGCQLMTAYGSAVSIGRLQAGREIFLTAAHCVAGNTRRIEVGINQKWHAASILARSENQADLALLSLDYSGSPIRAARLADAPADLGTHATLTGFPQGGAFRRRLGTVIPHRFLEIDLVIDQPSLPGESGGGIFNAQGELVGIISATAPANSPTQTLASGIPKIRQLLAQTFPAHPNCGRAFTPPPIDNSAAQLANLKNELHHLQTRLAELEAQLSKPPPADPAIHQRLERLEQIEIPVQILTPDGKILDEARYRLGEPLQFRLIPK